MAALNSPEAIFFFFWLGLNADIVFELSELHFPFIFVSVSVTEYELHRLQLHNTKYSILLRNIDLGSIDVA